MFEPGTAAQAPDRRPAQGHLQSNQGRPSWPALVATAVVAILAGAATGYSLRGGAVGSTGAGDGAGASATAATASQPAATPVLPFDVSVEISLLNPLLHAWLPAEIAGVGAEIRSARQLDPALGRQLGDIHAGLWSEPQVAAVLAATCPNWEVSWASAETEAWKVVVFSAPACDTGALLGAAQTTTIRWSGGPQRITVAGREVIYERGGSGWFYSPWRYSYAVPGRLWVIIGPLQEGRYRHDDVHRTALEILATLPAPQPAEE